MNPPHGSTANAVPTRQAPPWIASGLLVGAGMVVAAGYLLKSPALVRFVPDSAPMAPASAVNFILLGIALFLVHRDSRLERLLARGLALLVGSMAVIVLMTTVLRWPLVPEHWLLGHIDLADGGKLLASMAPNSAACFFLSAQAICLMTSDLSGRRRLVLLGCLGLIVLGVAAATMFGYLAEFRAGYNWWQDTGMPLLSTLLYLVLGSVILRHAWWGAGMRWSISLWGTVGFSCGLVLLFLVAAHSNRRSTEVVESSNQAKLGHQTIAKLQELRSAFGESQSNLRGLVITGDRQFVRALNENENRIHGHIMELRKLMCRDPAQLDCLATLDSLNDRRSEMAQVIIGRDPAAPRSPAQENDWVRQENRRMAEIEQWLNRVTTAERRRIIELDAINESVIREAFATMPAGVLLSMLALTLGLLRLNGEISQRQRGAEALRQANQLLHLHFEQTPMGVIEWDREFTVMRWNPAAQRIFGYSAEDAIGRHADFIIPERIRPQIGDIWRALQNRRGGERSTNENVCKQGQRIFCEWSNTPLIDDQGTFMGVASLVLDVTQRRWAEHLLGWEKDALELIASPATITEVLNGLILGLERELEGGMGSVLLMDDDGVHLRHGAAPSLPDAYNALMDSLVIGPMAGSCGSSAYLGEQIITEDIATDPRWETYRDLALNHNLRCCCSTPIHGDEGKILGTFALYYSEPHVPQAMELELVGRAVHILRIGIERKIADDEISKLKAALDEHAIVATTDAAGNITYVNDKFCAFAKYAREELIGKNHRIINSGYHPKSFFQEMWRTISHGRVWKGEIRNRAKDGSIYWVTTTIVPFLGRSGKPVQYVAIRTDITERKLAEAALRLKNLVFDSSIAANSISGLDGLLTEVNAAFLKLWGYDNKGEVLGASLPRFFYEPEEASCIVAALDAEGEWEGDFMARRKDGSSVMVHGLATVVRDEHASIIGYQSACIDVTERKRAEDEIRQLNASLEQRVQHRTQQLEMAVQELDAFSYSVSHDLRSPLRAIDGFSRLLSDSFGETIDHEGRRIIGVIRGETQRMGQLIDDLLEFSRLSRQPLEQQEIDMTSLAQSVFDELAAQVSGRRFHFTVGSLPSAFGSLTMLRQVWINLLSNAIKFTANRDPAVIEVGTIQGDDGKPRYFVRDNGAGFDMRHVDKLFGVFQRLHSQQEFPGTGVGLALVQRIITRHHGHIWAEGTLDHGACFYFTLPYEHPHD